MRSTTGRIARPATRAELIGPLEKSRRAFWRGDLEFWVCVLAIVLSQPSTPLNPLAFRVRMIPQHESCL